MLKVRPKNPVELDISDILYFKTIARMGLKVWTDGTDIYINDHGPHNPGQKVKVMPMYEAYKCESVKDLASEFIDNNIDFSFFYDHLRIAGFNQNINVGDIVIFTENGVRIEKSLENYVVYDPE